jgi:predicted transcriptional regulator
MRSGRAPFDTTVAFRVPAPLAQALDQIAQREERERGLRVDRSDVLRRALEQEVARYGGIAGLGVQIGASERGSSL